ncbi:MAG: N-acetylneuraminate synthase family protein [Bacteroidales bacterium]|nr:N-acetylneuraminate synthase family protein [Bacteroidales bacterium]
MRLIAETAWHHDGDFEFFKQLVTEIAQQTKVDYIKFHLTVNLDEYMHTDHPAYSWAKDRMFTEKQWDEILSIPTKFNKKLMLLFNDIKAIEYGMKFNPEIVEIHSVCLNDYKLLRHLKSKINNLTKVVLGVGGTDLYEIENAIALIGTSNIVLMHGFQNYPTKYEDINFEKVRRIMHLFPNFEHGYADHTAWDNENNILITLFGAALGVKYVEKHVSIRPGENRTDWQAAVSIDQFNKLTDKIEVLVESVGNGAITLNSGEKSYSVFGPNKKAGVLIKDVIVGDELSEELYSFKRTGQKADLSQIDIVGLHGKKFVKNLKTGHCIKKSDLE